MKLTIKFIITQFLSLLLWNYKNLSWLTFSFAREISGLVVEQKKKNITIHFFFHWITIFLLHVYNAFNVVKVPGL